MSLEAGAKHPRLWGLLSDWILSSGADQREGGATPTSLVFHHSVFWFLRVGSARCPSMRDRSSRLILYEKPLPRPGSSCMRQDFLTEVMGVRPDADGIHIGGQGERAAHFVVRLAGRNIDVGADAEEGGHLDLRHQARRRGAEVEADHGLLGLRQAVGVEVGLQEEVGSLG